MQIAVFGSTGGNGRLILREAGRRHHQVTAFARRAEALADVEGLARIVEGDARDGEETRRAIAGQDAVIVTVSGGGEPGAIAAIAWTVTTAMEDLGVSRLVSTSAYGIVARRPLVVAPLIRRIFRATFADQLAADETIRASALDWTILRATRLTGGSPARAPRESTELFERGPFSLTREAFAAALLDLAERPTRTREIVNISG
jgi:putative NADH-flavin reductase